MLIDEECVHASPSESLSTTRASPFAMIGSGATAWFRHLGFLDEAVADEPDYEATLVAGLSETIRPGDSVVVVGGGLGVTAVVAALRTGPSGTVQCFEGSKQYVRLVQQTAARNRITNINVHHAVVAKLILVYGSGSDLGPVLPPSQLPPCDVLQLDCEGAEVEILRELTIQPRVILVETHGVFGAPTELVASLLEKRGYVVSDRGVAEARYTEYCIKTDTRVLLGLQKRRFGTSTPLRLTECRVGSSTSYVELANHSCFAVANHPRCNGDAHAAILKKQKAPTRNDVRFSNRPVWVRRFQTIHHCRVDVARGLGLLSGIGTIDPPDPNAAYAHNEAQGIIFGWP